MKDSIKNILVTSDIVRCNGKGTSHPVIYLNIKNVNKIVCPYCGIIYFKDCYIGNKNARKKKHSAGH